MERAGEKIRTAIVALGANLGDRWATLDSAVRAIENRVGVVIKRSTWIETEALLDPSKDEPQPAYLNGVVLVETKLSPAEVLERLAEIEIMLGRIRSEGARWESRTIDLDLVGVDAVIVDSPVLKLPHPEMHKRSFVLEPLVEVWPEWVHPIIGQSAREMFEQLAD